jgi:MFS family permease
VGIIFYGFPVFYPELVGSLGFTRAQVTEGFLIGFFAAGLPFGLLAGAVIDRVGARSVILAGTGLIGISLMLMGFITRLWEYEALCIVEVLGYVMAGPLANQVLISKWFRIRRGQAMGYAYLGLGFGGVVSPLMVNFLIRTFGWRHAVEFVGAVIIAVLFPVGLWVTRSTPTELGLEPDGFAVTNSSEERAGRGDAVSSGVAATVRTANFWLILAGTTLVVGAIGAVIQHFILFLKDQGYSATAASQVSTALLASSLCSRVLVGYLADRFRKKNTMALFYLLLGATIPILHFAQRPVAAWGFALAFGFAMGADYMLIPLVTAECFGTASLGKLLALIIMGYSLGQWGAPWLVGKIFDAYHSYSLAWEIMTAAGMLGAAAIYVVSVPTNKVRT